MLLASDSLRKAVGSWLEAAPLLPLSVPPPPAPYRSVTTALALGWTTIFEPYVVSSAVSLSPTSNTTPSMATDTAADRPTVSAMSSRLRSCRLKERATIRVKNMGSPCGYWKCELSASRSAVWMVIFPPPAWYGSGTGLHPPLKPMVARLMATSHFLQMIFPSFS